MKNTRDFSDWALLRGALAANLCSYLIVMVLYPTVIFYRDFFDLDDLLGRLSGAFQPINLIVGLIFTSVGALLGLMFLAVKKRDHTTFRAAAVAGAQAAGFMLGFMWLIGFAPGLVVTLISHPVDILSPVYLSGARMFLWFVFVVLGTGATSGLLGRLAAGAPMIEQKPQV